MHFLGASRDGLVARRVDLDTISSSDRPLQTTMTSLMQCVVTPAKTEHTCVAFGKPCRLLDCDYKCH
jgi:hypothetical protein